MLSPIKRDSASVIIGRAVAAPVPPEPVEGRDDTARETKSNKQNQLLICIACA
jgi:hypothetical protein